MNHNYIFRNTAEALPVLMGDLLKIGEEVGSRAGRVKELTHVGITLTHPTERELLLPERKPSLAAQVAETMWVLSGRNDVGWLRHYLPRAEDFSDDGAVWRAGYGPRLRNFNGVDQLAYVVKTLRDSAVSRQAVISLWDPAVDTTPGKDIACNNWLVFTNRNGWLDLQVGIRSNDAMWGWSGINTFEWSALQEIVAGMVGVNVGKLHFSIASFHLYEQHWGRARKIRESVPVMRDNLGVPFAYADELTHINALDALFNDWFDREQDIRRGHETDIESFPEPMMRSWLRVLQWWWSGDREVLRNDPVLYDAGMFSVQPKPATDSFIDYVHKLHVEKHAAYGDSWKRRGEMLGILANIARKVDRLEAGTETSDETQLDTAVDAMVYLAKYRLWLLEQDTEFWKSYCDRNLGHTDQVRELLMEVSVSSLLISGYSLGSDLSQLEHRVMSDLDRITIVDTMLLKAYRLAFSRWKKQ